MVQSVGLQVYKSIDKDNREFYLIAKGEQDAASGILNKGVIRLEKIADSILLPESVGKTISSDFGNQLVSPNIGVYSLIMKGSTGRIANRVVLHTNDYNAIYEKYPVRALAVEKLQHTAHYTAEAMTFLKNAGDRS
jgi:hypothetical protein